MVARWASEGVGNERRDGESSQLQFEKEEKRSDDQVSSTRRMWNGTPADKRRD